MTVLPPAVFVYGTLKRGEERERCWPRPPLSVEPATVLGRLYDLGPYPALLPALAHDQDLVLGELWSFAASDLETTLRALDEVECLGVEDVDLYVRQVVACTTLAGTVIDAHCYFLADPREAERSQRVRPDPRGYCQWSRQASPPT